MDIVGPLLKTENGKEYLLTVQDDLLKFSLAVPLQATDANTVAKNFVEHIKIKNQLKNTNSLIVDIELEQFIEQQVILFNLMLSQVLFEVDLLGEIVTAAQGGVIHSSVLTPKDILEQLNKIEEDLPKHRALPVPLDIIGARRLLSIADVVCMFKNKTLIFLIRTPLVDDFEFTLYNLIPLPVKVNSNPLHMYVNPKMDYLAVSKDYESYISYRARELDKCKQTSDYKLCRGEQIIYNRHEKAICAIKLILGTTEMPKMCHVRYTTLIENIFHKLKSKNTWVYSVTQEHIVLDCEKEKTSAKFALVTSSHVDRDRFDIDKG
ncbi:Ribonuclease H-like domain,Envelope fusion protein-like [Cinara cedri]|uniref:Ribonuclease H-like domain,Envelope fusion protein-like n=1 Tax=Cinara cedri TaxID=506608 RepID=A0A5E4NAK1_9HEMI|nr:Ribonuclease H-like domain,Envelope fusion protein-like [Cinara cedri]